MAETKEATKLLDEYIKNPPKEEDTDKKTEKKKYKYENERRFSCVTYIDIPSLDKWLKTSPWIHHYAYCHHDCDKWTEADEKENSKHKAGTQKEPHTHVILYTYAQKTSSAILKNFQKLSKLANPENPQNTKVQYCSDCGAQFRYLIHSDDPEKYQYNEKNRVCDDLTWWMKLCKTDGLNDTRNNLGMAMVDDVLNGATEREMCERYGKEWIYHRKYILESVRAIDCEERTGKSPKLDETILRLMLESSHFYQIDIEKFFEILNYINKECIEQYGDKADFTLYFEEKKQCAN